MLHVFQVHPLEWMSLISITSEKVFWKLFYLTILGRRHVKGNGDSLLGHNIVSQDEIEFKPNRTVLLKPVKLEERLENDPQPSDLAKLYARHKNQSNFHFEHSEKQINDFK